MSVPARVPEPSAPVTAHPPLLWRPGAARWLRLLIPSLVVAGAQGLSLLSLADGGSIGVVSPVAGVAVLWLAAYVGPGTFWRNSEFWIAAACLALVSAVVSSWEEHTVPMALALGLGNVAQGVLTNLCWSRWPQLGHGQPILTWLGRALAACAAGAAASIIFAPTVGVLTGHAEIQSLGHWLVRNMASAFLVSVLGSYLLSRPPTGLPASPRWATPALGAATAIVLCVLILVPVPDLWVLFLLVPIGVFAAWALTVRGVALFSTLITAVVIILAVRGSGPFTLGSTTERASLAQLFIVVTVLVHMALVLDRTRQARLQAEVAVERSSADAHSAMLARMAHTISEGVAVFAQDGSIVMHNAAAAQILGRLDCPEQIWAENPDNPVAMVLAGAATASTDATVSGHGAIEDAVYSVHCYPLVSRGQRMALVILHDVTPERRRTSELRRFARMAAHDLRSPLAALALWAESGLGDLEAGDTERVAYSLKRILGTTMRMDELVSDLLDYTVASDGDLQPSPVHLGDMISSCARGRQAGLDARGLRLNLSIDADVMVDVDPRLIRRVFDNLIGNAIKYTAAGDDPSIEIVARPDSAGWAQVTLRDRGVGIPPGQEELIFQEFHRVPEHAETSPGSGIGLAICARVVARHGGRISAAARPGGGSEFQLSLPLWQPETVEGSTPVVLGRGHRRRRASVSMAQAS